jgi:hypothetical protein
MLDNFTAWVFSAVTMLAFFVGQNMEPSAGVWVVATLGGALGAMTGKDCGLGRSAIAFIVGIGVGVFGSQAVVWAIKAQEPQAQVAASFFLALFSERIVDFVQSGGFGRIILARFGGGK